MSHRGFRTRKVEANDIRTKEADDWGRLYLGTEYANKRVTVAVVEIETDRPSEDELAKEYRDPAESARDSNRDWAHVSDEAWDSLGPAPRVEGYDE